MRPEKKTQLGEADFSWKLKDYKKHGKEAPERIRNNTSKTEGEMMRDSEIEEWFSESVRVLEILKEEDKDKFLKIYNGFILDLEYLFSLKRIDEGALEFAQDLNNFDF